MALHLSADQQPTVPAPRNDGDARRRERGPGRRRLGIIAVFLLATVVLTPVFRWNALGAADPTSFTIWQLDSQALVTAKIESTTPEARARGINALGMLIAVPDPEAPNATFDELAAGGHPTTTRYLPYPSQSGLPGYLFTALYHLGLTTISGLQIATSAMFAATLLLFSFLLGRTTHRSFGWVFFVVALGSPWLALAGRNLYWVPWTWFLPACAAMWYVRATGRIRLLSLAALAVAFVVRWSSGYEFITSIALLAAAMPVLSAVFHPDQFRRVRLVVRDTAVIAGIGVACFVVSIVALAFQVGAGKFAYGISAILYDVGKRTYGGVPVSDPAIAASFAAHPLDVVATYLFGWGTNLVSFSFGTPAALVLGPNSLWALVMGSVAIVVIRRFRSDKWWRRDATILVVALVVPLSFIIAAKAHAYVHPFIDFEVWYLISIGALIWIVGAALIPLARDGLRHVGRMIRTPLSDGPQ